jgi:crotonobetainyl-CoA:carnitine CoA-transferase CaiB-like acyl-CoA transferase
VDPTSAPAVGQHTEEVLRDILGFDEGRFSELSAKGVFGAPVQRHEPAEIPA